MKKLVTAAAVVAALALTGCTAGNSSAEPSAPATATPSASASVEPTVIPASPSAAASKTVDPGQAWADDMINLFLNGNSKSTFDEFNDEIPHHFITNWAQESEGVMSVTVSGKQWTKCDMDELAVTIMSTAGHETPEMKKVVTYSSSNGLKGSTDRDGMNFGTPESC